jgi:hypothetical protein
MSVEEVRDNTCRRLRLWRIKLPLRTCLLGDTASGDRGYNRLGLRANVIVDNVHSTCHTRRVEVVHRSTGMYVKIQLYSLLVIPRNTLSVTTQEKTIRIINYSSSRYF